MNFNGTIFIVGKNSKSTEKLIKTALRDIQIKAISDIKDMQFSNNGGKAIFAVLPDFRRYEAFSKICCDASIICPYVAKHFAADNISENSKITTYASEENNADLILKNLRERDGISFFELLHENDIGRVYFSTDNHTDVTDIIVCIGVMLECGFAFRSILEFFSKENKI